METNEQGIILKNFILYCKKNIKNLEKTISKIIDNLDETEDNKITLKYLLKSILKKSYPSVQFRKLYLIYLGLIIDMCPSIIKVKKHIYFNFNPIYSFENNPDTDAIIYESYMKNKKIISQVIIKAFPIAYFNKSNKIELNIIRALSKEELCVPKLIDVFKTEHYNCFSMEKIQMTIFSYLNMEQKGLDILKFKKLFDSFIPILKYMHLKLGYLYCDFSPNNIGINFYGDEYDFFIFDFNSVEKITENTKPNGFFPRYGSINMLKSGFKNNISIYDDFESLGFLLLDLYYWESNKNPLGSLDDIPTIEYKKKIN